MRLRLVQKLILSTNPQDFKNVMYLANVTNDRLTLDQRRGLAQYFKKTTPDLVFWPIVEEAFRDSPDDEMANDWADVLNQMHEERRKVMLINPAQDQYRLAIEARLAKTTDYIHTKSLLERLINIGTPEALRSLEPYINHANPNIRAVVATVPGLAAQNRPINLSIEPMLGYFRDSGLTPDSFDLFNQSFSNVVTSIRNVPLDRRADIQTRLVARHREALLSVGTDPKKLNEVDVIRALAANALGIRIDDESGVVALRAEEVETIRTSTTIANGLLREAKHGLTSTAVEQLARLNYIPPYGGRIMLDMKKSDDVTTSNAIVVLNKVVNQPDFYIAPKNDPTINTIFEELNYTKDNVATVYDNYSNDNKVALMNVLEYPTRQLTPEQRKDNVLRLAQTETVFHANYWNENIEHRREYFKLMDAMREVMLSQQYRAASTIILPNELAKQYSKGRVNWPLASILAEVDERAYHTFAQRLPVEYKPYSQDSLLLDEQPRWWQIHYDEPWHGWTDETRYLYEDFVQKHRDLRENYSRVAPSTNSLYESARALSIGDKAFLTNAIIGLGNTQQALAPYIAKDASVFGGIDAQMSIQWVMGQYPVRTNGAIQFYEDIALNTSAANATNNFNNGDLQVLAGDQISRSNSGKAEATMAGVLAEFSTHSGPKTYQEIAMVKFAGDLAASRNQRSVITPEIIKVLVSGEDRDPMFFNRFSPYNKYEPAQAAAHYALRKIGQYAVPDLKQYIVLNQQRDRTNEFNIIIKRILPLLKEIDPAAEAVEVRDLRKGHKFDFYPKYIQYNHIYMHFIGYAILALLGLIIAFYVIKNYASAITEKLSGFVPSNMTEIFEEVKLAIRAWRKPKEKKTKKADKAKPTTPKTKTTTPPPPQLKPAAAQSADAKDDLMIEDDNPILDNVDSNDTSTNASSAATDDKPIVETNAAVLDDTTTIPSDNTDGVKVMVGDEGDYVEEAAPNRLLRLLDIVVIALTLWKTRDVKMAIEYAFMWRAAVFGFFIANEWGHILESVLRGNFRTLTLSNILGNLNILHIVGALIPVLGYYAKGPSVTVQSTLTNRLAGAAVNISLVAAVIAYKHDWMTSPVATILPWPIVMAASVFALIWSIQTDILRLGVGDKSECGNFGIGGILTEEESKEIAPHWVQEGIKNQINLITIRGGQTIGLVHFVMNKSMQTILVLLKEIKGKRANLENITLNRWLSVIEKLIESGYFLGTRLGIWSGHVRFATAGKATKKASHPHVQFIEERISYWDFNEKGILVQKFGNFIIAITHNGDFDDYFILGRKLDNGNNKDELRPFLRRALYVKQLKKPSDYPWADDTPGDSPPASGIARLFWTQQRFTASWQLGFVLSLSKPEDLTGGKDLDDKNAPNTMLPINDRNYLATISDRVFAKHAAAVSRPKLRMESKALNHLYVTKEQVAKHPQLKAQYDALQALQNDLVQQLQGDAKAMKIISTFGGGEAKINEIVGGVVRNFFLNNRYHAGRQFQKGSFGSFGFVIRTSIPDDGVTLFTLDQSISLGWNTVEKFFAFASEALVLQVKYGDRGYLTHRLDMDIQGRGEVIDFTMTKDGRPKIRGFNANLNRELTTEDIEARKMELDEQKNPYFRKLQEYDPGANLLWVDFEDTASVLHWIRNSFLPVENPSLRNQNLEQSKFNAISTNELVKMVNGIEIERYLRKYSTKWGSLDGLIRNQLIGYTNRVFVDLQPDARRALTADFIRAVENNTVMVDYVKMMLTNQLGSHAENLASRLYRRNPRTRITPDQMHELITDFDKDIQAHLSELSQWMVKAFVDSQGRLVEQWEKEVKAFQELPSEKMPFQKALSVFSRMVHHLRSIFRRDARRNVLPEFKQRHIIITGFEKSQWAGEKLKEVLEHIFPDLNIDAISSNKLIADPKKFGATKRTIFIAISDSGQTFPTLSGTGKLYKLFGDRVFVVTNRVDSMMGMAIGQRFNSKSRFKGRIFVTGANIRLSEASTVDTTALIFEILEIAINLAEGVKNTFPKDNPLGMRLDEIQLKLLKEKRDEALAKIETIVGKDADGNQIESDMTKAIDKDASKWEWRVKEVMWGKVVGVVHVILGVIIAPLLFHKLLVTGIILHMDPGFKAYLIEATAYLFNIFAFTILLRFIQKRPLWERLGNPTIVIGEESVYHQILELLVRKLRGTAHSSQEVHVHGGNAEDHFGARFLSGVVRGTKGIFGMPIEDAKFDAVKMTAKQTKGVLSGFWRFQKIFMGSAEVFTFGQRQLNDKNATDSHHHLGDVDFTNFNSHTRELHNKMYDGLVRMVAIQRFFVKMFTGISLIEAKGSDKFLALIWKYFPWDSTSKTKVYTTRSPKPIASGDNDYDVVWDVPSNMKEERIKEEEAAAASNYPAKLLSNQRLTYEALNDEQINRYIQYSLGIKKQENLLDSLDYLGIREFERLVDVRYLDSDDVAYYDFTGIEKPVVINKKLMRAPVLNVEDKDSVRFIALLNDILRHEIIGHHLLGPDENPARDVSRMYFLNNANNRFEYQYFHEAKNVFGIQEDMRYYALVNAGVMGHQFNDSNLIAEEDLDFVMSKKKPYESIFRPAAVRDEFQPGKRVEDVFRQSVTRVDPPASPDGGSAHIMLPILMAFYSHSLIAVGLTVLALVYHHQIKTLLLKMHRSIRWMLFLAGLILATSNFSTLNADVIGSSTTMVNETPVLGLFATLSTPTGAFIVALITAAIVIRTWIANRPPAGTGEKAFEWIATIHAKGMKTFPNAVAPMFVPTFLGIVLAQVFFPIQTTKVLSYIPISSLSLHYVATSILALATYVGFYIFHRYIRSAVNALDRVRVSKTIIRNNYIGGTLLAVSAIGAEIALIYMIGKTQVIATTFGILVLGMVRAYGFKLIMDAKMASLNNKGKLSLELIYAHAQKYLLMTAILFAPAAIATWITGMYLILDSGYSLQSSWVFALQGVVGLMIFEGLMYYTNKTRDIVRELYTAIQVRHVTNDLRKTINDTFTNTILDLKIPWTDAFFYWPILHASTKVFPWIASLVDVKHPLAKVGVM